MTHAQSLSAYTTLRLGGPARAVVECADTLSLVETVTRLDHAGEPVLLIGGGSNLVIGDDGFGGTAVIVRSTGIEFGSDDDGPFVTAAAGTDWDELVAATVDAGFGGLECLSGIPGAAGTTPVQNVGAYGVEVGDLLRGVELLDRTTGGREWVAPSDLGLGYRTSKLKGADTHVVLTVSFRLNADAVSEPIAYRELAQRLGVDEGATASARLVREVVLGLRVGKGMVLDAEDHDTWSAGSFFTNPVIGDDRIDRVIAAITDRVGDDVRIPRFPADGGTKLSAGWLIERAGFTRGYPDEQAPARLSTKHTLALTNRGDATTDDLVTLAADVRDGVRDAFGVELHPEPVFVSCSLPR
ncbi:UDP-N-acetylenolpyruvoylglucosamine reductase [Gordonia spumicola]|uniref:UDP-N-acetylenolpyruvoylglucosamine reductase n=1 Tax=Gordonia spumicola TaxID=589161 RepID=A0A7I9V7V6_9ACTN|nr:UDP-N-acetylmuramate dehydrogenase [Gordonia spumicola]GEE01292.1 UDP-N-acetylenolpyruvoylglucosamine reductase [Gordonia spumicola]